jgi:hypothetical protein
MFNTSDKTNDSPWTFFGRAALLGCTAAACLCLATIGAAQATDQAGSTKITAPVFPIACARADLDLFTAIEMKGLEDTSPVILVFAQELLQAARHQCSGNDEPGALQTYASTLSLLNQGTTLASHAK